MDQQISAKAWREDLWYLADELPNRHQNLFHTMTPQQFECAVAMLRARIPSLARHQIVAELARMIAMIGDGHTYLDLFDGPNVDFRRYPLRLYLYHDGLFVQAAAADKLETLGSQVLAIGDTPVAVAYTVVRELVARDNEMWVKHIAPRLLMIPEVLHSLDLVADMERAQLSIKRPNGERVIVDLHPISNAADTSWRDAAGASQAPTPLWLKDPENKFWFTYLEKHRTLYVQYNSVRDKPEETVAAFFDRVFAFADAHPIDRFVLDIRRNGGGNGYLNQPIIHGLIKRERINQPGKLFTIIGRGTFSAAMMLADDLERHTRTLFVGEPTGASPNMYGDPEKIVLPNSGLEVWASALHWVYSEPRDIRPWIAPDIGAELASEDYRVQRDPALEAILRYVPSPENAELVAFPTRLWRELEELERAGHVRPARYRTPVFAPAAV
jgi:hypothetical protein